MLLNDQKHTILVAEDDPNDFMLLERALRKNSILNPLQLVRDGEETVAYLSGTGKYSNRKQYPPPRFLILDLKMPRMGGLEVLEWLQNNRKFQVTPTLVLSSSRHDEDVQAAYRLGASSYLVKPSSFDDLQTMIKVVYDYWAFCHRPEST